MALGKSVSFILTKSSRIWGFSDLLGSQPMLIGLKCDLEFHRHCNSTELQSYKEIMLMGLYLTLWSKVRGRSLCSSKRLQIIPYFIKSLGKHSLKYRADRLSFPFRTDFEPTNGEDLYMNALVSHYCFQLMCLDQWIEVPEN